MSELDEILNDDLLTCEFVKSAENEVRRVDLIKWTHYNTFSVAEVHKDTGEIELTDFETSYSEACEFFDKNYGGISTIS